MPLVEIAQLTFPGGNTTVGGPGSNTGVVYADSHGGPLGKIIDNRGSAWNVDANFLDLADPGANFGNDGFVFYDQAFGDGYVEIETPNMGTSVVGRVDLVLRLTVGIPANTSTYYWLYLTSSGGGGSGIFKVSTGHGLGNPSPQDALPGTGDAIWVDGHSYRIRFTATGTSPVAFAVTITDLNTSAVHNYTGGDSASPYAAGRPGMTNLGGLPNHRASVLRLGATPGINSTTTTIYTNLTPQTVAIGGVGTSFTSGSVVTVTGAGTSLGSFTALTATTANVAIVMTPGTTGTSTLTIDGLSMTFTVSNPIPPIPGAYTAVGNVANITGAIVANPTVDSPDPSQFTYTHNRSAFNGTPFGTGDSTLVGTGLNFTYAAPDLLPVYLTCRVAYTPTGLFADAPQSAHRIVARFVPGWIGDSITQHGSLQAPFCRQLRSKYNVDAGLGTLAGQNQGIQATTAQDWLIGAGTGYLPAALTALHAISAQKIFLMLGTNNAVNGDSVAVFIAAYTQVVNSIVASGFQVIMNAPPFMIPGAAFTVAMSTLVSGYAAAIQALANGTTILMGDRHGANDYFLNNQGDSVDGVHPTDPAGHMALGNVQADAAALALGYAVATGGSIFQPTNFLGAR